MNEKRPAYLHYDKSYRISQKNPRYVTIEKNTRAYDNRFRPNYDVATSSLNIAIKSRKQPQHR